MMIIIIVKEELLTNMFTISHVLPSPFQSRTQFPEQYQTLPSASAFNINNSSNPRPQCHQRKQGYNKCEGRRSRPNCIESASDFGCLLSDLQVKRMR